MQIVLRKRIGIKDLNDFTTAIKISFVKLIEMMRHKIKIYDEKKRKEYINRQFI